MLRLAAILTLAAAPALAEPRIVECIVDLPASEGAWVTLHQDGEEVRHIVLTIAGEMGAVGMDVTPIGESDAIATYRRLEYSRHAFAGEGPIDVFLREEARLLVRDGKVCPEENCAWGEDPAALREFWDAFYAAFAGRSDCTEME